MELIVISESKLKIMLSGADMARYDLEGEALEGGDPHTREVFRRILEDAGTAVGFNTLGERLFVQYYATVNGEGCEIFVTKLGGAADEALTEGEEALLRRVYACGEETEDLRRCYSFDRAEDLLAVCRRLRAIGFEGESRVYITEGTEARWYLFLRMAEAVGSRVPKRFAFLGEYGRPSGEESLDIYLSEYGRVICPRGAVELLSEF